MKVVSFWIPSSSSATQTYEVEESLQLTTIEFVNCLAFLSLEPTSSFAGILAEVSPGQVSDQVRFFLFNPANSNPGLISGLNLDLEKGTQICVSSQGSVGSLGVIQLFLLNSADLPVV